MPSEEKRASRRSTIARWSVPWAVALLLLVFLVSTTDVSTLRQSLKQGPWLWLAAFMAIQVPAVLSLDSVAAYLAFRLLRFDLRYSTVFVLRGASYILGILNYGLGQGALALLLRRFGVGTRSALTAMALLLSTSFGALIIVTSSSLVANPIPSQLPVGLERLVLVLLAGFIAYSLGQRFLGSIPVLSRISAPLADITLKTQALATAARLPHVALLVISQWLALRIWGIPVPFTVGLFAVPIVLLVAALPIAPQGLGTSQAAQILLFTPYVMSSTRMEARAMVLAFGISFFTLGLMAQGLTSVLCWRRVKVLARSKDRLPTGSGEV